ncbi:MAG: TSUP family transporter, partial [Acidobacteriia bacterium]|nr:TSUP family transporter [Terriglobia bacterium]
MVVGFLSAVVGSAGPLGAAVFLSLHLPPPAYVATEAVTATLMHLTKSVIYGRYALMTAADLLMGLALGGAMVLGSWTGRKLIERLSPQWVSRLVESLLVLAALSLIFV